MPVWIGSVECDGQEDKLQDCRFSHGDPPCDHDEDAGCVCFKSLKGGIKVKWERKSIARVRV